MKKTLFAAAAIVGLVALSGCCSGPAGVAANGPWTAYDGGYDSGTQGYDRPYDGYGYQIQPAPCPYGMRPGCYCPPGYRY